MSGPPKEPGKSQGLGEAILSWRSRDWTELTMVDPSDDDYDLVYSDTESRCTSQRRP